MISITNKKDGPPERLPMILFCCILVMTLASGCENGKKGILEASALVSSCIQLTEPEPIGRIYTNFVLSESLYKSIGTPGRLVAAGIDCLRSADDCDDVFGCLYANPEQAKVCESVEYDEKCSGNVLVDCWSSDGRYEITDCGRAGLTCAETETSAACGESHCEGPVEPCDGDIYQDCQSAGLLTMYDCSWLGGTCGVGTDGYSCVGDGEECSGGPSPRCEGDVAYHCLEGRVAHLDCAGFVANGTCVEIETEVFCGLDDGCIPYTSEECVNGVISFCHLGVITELDCIKLGYSGCDTFNDWDYGGAFCTPATRTPCDELHDIQKEICAPADECFPCVCILGNEGWDIAERIGLPDISMSSCTGPRGMCVDEKLVLAERCLALGRPERGDEGWEAWISECDPRYAYDIWLFDDNETYNSAFPEVCSGVWW